MIAAIVKNENGKRELIVKENSILGKVLLYIATPRLVWTERCRVGQNCTDYVKMYFYK